MNPSDQNPEDRQLDDLLRQVEVPQDLKAKLHKLPKAISMNGVRPAPMPSIDSGKKHWPRLFLLAATLLGVSAFFAWPFLGSSPSETSKTNKGDGQLVTDKANPILDLQLDLKQVENLQTQIDVALARLEISQLEQRLQELQTTSVESLGQRQHTSIILAMADQTVLDLGGSPTSVHSNMVSVIDNFPGSMGAEIAQQFLDQHTN